MAGKPIVQKPATAMTNSWHGNPMVFAFARDQARRKGRGLRAPLAAIDAVEAATKLNFEDGCRREAELFNECLYSNESKALIHAFFGERAVAKIPGIPKESSPCPSPKPPSSEPELWAAASP